MRKMLILAITILVALTLVACNAADAPADSSNNTAVSASRVYYTFEEVLPARTDVVIVNYVGHRPFGERLTEFEFTVVDRIVGNAADTIFVYSSDALSFTEGSDYLLALYRLWQAHRRTHPDGFMFIGELIINLDDPTKSTMYNEPLYLHATELDFNSMNLTREQIIAFVAEKTANNPPGRDHIRSDNIMDIITGSSYVLVVDIDRPLRLVDEQVSRDWMETDIYYVTVVEALKGDIDVGAEMNVAFFADTVQTGERHTVAVRRVSEGGTSFDFTSRDSLYSMNQRDEILEILAAHVGSSLSFDQDAYNMAIPESGSATITVSATAYYASGQAMHDPEMVFSLASAYPGVTIHRSTGVVTVKSFAQPGVVTIRAVARGLEATVPLTLTLTGESG